MPSTREYKRCPRCGETKHWTEFGMRPNGYLRSYCEPCRKIYEQDYFSRPETREKHSQWKLGHREEVKKYNKGWWAAHPEKRRAKYTRWYNSHQEEALAKHSKWQQEHPENVAAAQHKRRTKKAGNGGSFTPAEWKTMLEHYGYRCLCCKRDDVKLTADHVMPVSLGGNSNISNIQPLCKPCNSKKHNRYIDYRLEWK